MADGAGATVAALAAHPYLESSGWLKSRELKMPVDSDARPIPWFTYSVIEFLARRVQPDMHVFEFGSGNSTLWWAERTATVTAVEHDERWAGRMRARLSGNASLFQVAVESDGEYCRSALHGDRSYHVIVIDGRDRVNCAQNCLGSLRKDGVIVWDDTHRSRYRPGFRWLARRGFRRLEFSGLGPMDAVSKETSVFYRADNCLGI